ncbi:hypothetical protein DITRI_Ditri02bG0126100 [Diplodiscus trichospermus]
MEGFSVRTLEKICVFYGANYGKDESYFKVAHRLGEVLGKRGINLIYGEGSLGLIGCVSTAATVHGSCNHDERLLKMMEFGDAFIALPGGFGKLEELFQIVSWAQLNIHKKPIDMLNVNGFFDGLLSFLDHGMEQKFITQSARKILISASTADELIDKLQTFYFELDPTTSQLNWPIESSQK